MSPTVGDIVYYSWNNKRVFRGEIVRVVPASKSCEVVVQLVYLDHLIRYFVVGRETWCFANSLTRIPALELLAEAAE